MNVVGTSGVPVPATSSLVPAIRTGTSIANRLFGGTGFLGLGPSTGGQIAPILAKARANTGQPMTSKKIVNLIRNFGFEVAGEFLGLSYEELATIWLHASRRRKRRWTRRDMSRARGYIRHLQRCERELDALRPRRRTARRTSSRSGPSITQVK